LSFGKTEYQIHYVLARHGAAEGAAQAQRWSRAKRSGVQAVENAWRGAIADFVSLSDQGLTEGRNAIADYVAFRFISSRFVFVSPDFAPLRRAPAGVARRPPQRHGCCGGRFIFLKPSVFAAP
jgi:hypothetical protein